MTYEKWNEMRVLSEGFDGVNCPIVGKDVTNKDNSEIVVE